MSGLFKTPKVPEIDDPLPIPDEEAQTDARQRRIRQEQQGSTVANTILSGGGKETLGA